MPGAGQDTSPSHAAGCWGGHPPDRGWVLPWECRGPSSPAHDAGPCRTAVPAPICLSKQPPLPLHCVPAPGRPRGTHPPPTPHRDTGTHCHAWRGDDHGPPPWLTELSAEPDFPGDLTAPSPSAERSRSNRGARPELSGRLEDGTALPSSELAAPRGGCALPHAQPGKEPCAGAASPWMQSDGATAMGFGGLGRGCRSWQSLGRAEPWGLGCVPTSPWQEGWEGAPSRERIPKH